MAEAVHRSLTALSANGDSEVVNVHQIASGVRSFAVQYTKVGTVTTGTVKAQGSLDGTNFFDIDGAGTDVSTEQIIFLVDKPVPFLRFNLASLTGGGSVKIDVYGS